MTRADGGRDLSASHELSVKVQHDGHVVAAADVTTSEAHGTAKVALLTPHADAPDSARGELVDQVLDHPEVRPSDSVKVVAPLGDSGALGRLQERTTNYHARAAGASSVVEAEVTRPDEQD